MYPPSNARAVLSEPSHDVPTRNQVKKKKSQSRNVNDREPLQPHRSLPSRAGLERRCSRQIVCFRKLTWNPCPLSIAHNDLSDRSPDLLLRKPDGNGRNDTGQYWHQNHGG